MTKDIEAPPARFALEALEACGRELLRDPYWPHRAARELGGLTRAPQQYGRAA